MSFVFLYFTSLSHRMSRQVGPVAPILIASSGFSHIQFFFVNSSWNEFKPRLKLSFSRYSNCVFRFRGFCSLRTLLNVYTFICQFLNISTKYETTIIIIGINCSSNINNSTKCNINLVGRLRISTDDQMISIMENGFCILLKSTKLRERTIPDTKDVSQPFIFRVRQGMLFCINCWFVLACVRTATILFSCGFR